VVTGVCDGFIGNRMIEQYGRQAGFLLDEGCTPAQVDGAAEAWGMAMGPFRMGDLAGNDIGWAIRKRRTLSQPGMRYSKTADLLCEMGRFGQKTGAGWYDYLPGKRDALPSAAVAAMIEKHRAALGIKPRPISDDEIVHRLVYALVNEAARILDEGIAGKASDIDIVYLTGYGFPLHRGGPLCYADSQGLFNVVQAMQRFAANPLDDATFWQPAPLLARLAAEGKSFT
jgi:3-hydroxyacyl-CoA dehydrogenase